MTHRHEKLLGYSYFWTIWKGIYPFVFMIHTVNTSLHTFFTQMKKMKILIILFLVIKGKELLYWLYICLLCLNRIPNIFES